MKVGRARETAIEWVRRTAARDAAYRGSYFSGSTVGLSAEAELPASSDVDIVVVDARDVPPPSLGKFRYHDVLLEVSYLPMAALASAQTVLGSCHLAGSFIADTVIDDPTGRLAQLRVEVSRGFADPVWVLRRCADARMRVLGHLAAIDPSGPFHDQVARWLFGTGVTTHLVLVAARRNPTIRLRYLAARGVLERYGLSEIHTELLELLGCARLTKKQALGHLSRLERVFDEAARLGVTGFFFSGDITQAARCVAIDGTRHLVERGDHREAVFWLVATFARCHTILASADSPRHRELLPDFRSMVADLGITSTNDMLERADQVRRYLPRLWRVAETIVATTP